MVDITTIVRKPPTKAAWGRFLIPVREAAVGIAGFLFGMPFAMFFFRIGWTPVGIVILFFTTVIAVFASQAKADGQSIPRYMLSAAKGRIGRHQIDGEWLPVYVGLAKVADFHHGEPVLIQKSAVEINPDLVDERGHITMPSA